MNPFDISFNLLVCRPGAGVNLQLATAETQHAGPPYAGRVVERAQRSDHFRAGESAGISITTQLGKRILAIPGFGAGLTSIALNAAGGISFEASPGNRVVFNSLELLPVRTSFRCRWYRDGTEMPSSRPLTPSAHTDAAVVSTPPPSRALTCHSPKEILWFNSKEILNSKVPVYNGYGVRFQYFAAKPTPVSSVRLLVRKIISDLSVVLVAAYSTSSSADQSR